MSRSVFAFRAQIKISNSTKASFCHLIVLRQGIIACAGIIKQSTSSIQSSKYFRKDLNTLHGVRIVWIFTLLDELFLCFYQAGRRGQCFIVPFSSMLFFQARSLQKFCLILFNCMITSSVPTSCIVCLGEGSTSSIVFYSVSSLFTACCGSMFLEASTVYFVYSDLA